MAGVLRQESEEQATERLRACNASPRWIAQVVAGRPYPDVDSLLDTAERAARALDWTEVQRALDAHPRIGERAEGASTEAQWSRREQSAVGTSDAGTQDALRTGNAAYDAVSIAWTTSGIVGDTQYLQPVYVFTGTFTPAEAEDTYPITAYVPAIVTGLQPVG